MKELTHLFLLYFNDGRLRYSDSVVIEKKGEREYISTLFPYGSLLATHLLCECLTLELPHRWNRYMYLAPCHIFSVLDSWLAWNNGRVNSRR